jgi:Na+/phosphate symporter
MEENKINNQIEHASFLSARQKAELLKLIPQLNDAQKSQLSQFISKNDKSLKTFVQEEQTKKNQINENHLNRMNNLKQENKKNIWKKAEINENRKEKNELEALENILENLNEAT